MILNAFLIGASLGPLLLVGLVHLVFASDKHSAIPTALPSRAIGAAEVVLVAASLAWHGPVMPLVVVASYASITLRLAHVHRDSNGYVPCGCSIALTSYVDGIVIARGAALTVISAAGAITYAPGRSQADVKWLTSGALVGVALFIAGEALSALRANLRANDPVMIGEAS